MVKKWDVCGVIQYKEIIKDFYAKSEPLQQEQCYGVLEEVENLPQFLFCPECGVVRKATS